ncbi:TATA-box-binding protein [Natronolimnohabitans sp. A-GB9]|uniref:TATA-box-binding protein n=1 Tax=Natronolimnohabitans sp. A-GB9 TaxID=3069757 RepID=UPI0027B6B4AD|nr:TATA-box-binding protein [Natronolimnohabitans sp. A-GB9]MDQ2050739.1 TATA-box-binding protein [Natronolimnohabitans sp. A-GB9]
MVTITNVVGSGSLGLELDVEQLGADLDVPYTEYNPENYHGLYVRLEEDGPLITVYRSGKYIITGSSSLDQLEESNDVFLDKLSALNGIETPEETGFSVQNIVSTAELGTDVNLNALSIGLGLESTEYEPEQFPGLVYRPEEYAAVILLFANGKVVITGAPNIDVATDAFDHLRSRVNSLL